MEIINVLAKIVLGFFSMLGSAAIIRFIRVETGGNLNNLFRVLRLHGDLGDMMLGFFIYPLIILIGLSIYWIFRGIDLQGAAIFKYFILVLSILMISIIIFKNYASF